MNLNPPRSRRGAVARGCLIAVAALVLFTLMLGGCAVTKYNGIVDSRETVDAKWSAVESDYENRADQIPNLVKTVTGAKNFESDTLQAVVEARAKATSVSLDASSLDDPDAVNAFFAAQEGLGSALSRLLVTVEDYPELRATEAFRDLQVQLEGIGNRINVSRKKYIESVAAYNKSVKRFPGNIMAGMFDYEPLPQYTVDEKAMELPEVDFDDE